MFPDLSVCFEGVFLFYLFMFFLCSFCVIFVSVFLVLCPGFMFRSCCIPLCSKMAKSCVAAKDAVRCSPASGEPVYTTSDNWAVALPAGLPAGSRGWAGRIIMHTRCSFREL